jgi:hypothetical protein
MATLAAGTLWWFCARRDALEVRILVEGIPNHWMAGLAHVITDEAVGLRMREERAPTEEREKQGATSSERNQEFLQFREHTHF